MSLLAIILGGLIVAILAAIYFVFASFAWGAGYQPAPPRVARRMLELGEVGPNDLVYDLGAGTGALVFRAARDRGARAVGIEMEPLRVLILRLRRSLGAAASRIAIHWGNIFHLDLSDATVVVAFLWPDAMLRLKPQFERQLRPGARVVSHWHPVPGWRADDQDRELRVYLYRMPPTRDPDATGTRGP